MRALSSLIIAMLTSTTLPVVGAEPPTAAPGYVQDSSGRVVVSSTGACWHSGYWTPAQAVVVGCDGVLAKATPIAPPVPRAQAPEPPLAVEETPLILPPAEPTPPIAKQAPPEKITLDTDAYFDFDKAELKPDGQRRLEEIASRLQKMKLEVIVAVGYADATGAAKYNEDLSRRRAEAVKSFFESRGLPANRIHTNGKGESDPIASNATREGRAKNRRVEIEVVGKKTPD
jgi:OOP family OmpA-OmpF porin